MARAVSSYLRDASGAWQVPLVVDIVGSLAFTPIGAAMLLDGIYAATSLANASG